MFNPDMSFRDVCNKQETADKNARGSGKRKPWLPHGRDRFTYTVKRLQSGCLVFQLRLNTRSSRFR
jgi:hypothetical protein